MRESKDFINDILLKNIDKEITINFSLLTTPVKDNPSMSKKTLPLLVKHLPFLNLKITSMKIMTKQRKYN